MPSPLQAEAHADAIVVGAGVIGLAVARQLAMSGREVLVLESERLIGTGTSSRNSEVIHAGIYYPTGSLKARLCVAGRQALYRYCEDRSIAHRRTGKLIVATDESQLAQLERIRQQATANQVFDLQLLSRAEALELEPHLDCAGALLSPSTGIIDSHELMMALRADAEAHGAAVVFDTPIIAGTIHDRQIIITTGGTHPLSLSCDTLVNAAGLGAWRVVSAMRGFPVAAIPARWLAKGNYFALESGRAPFRHLVYPVPEDGGLGVHLTLDLSGQARFGPDVEWLATAEIDYTVDGTRAEGFEDVIRRYWPGIVGRRLVPAYSGIRPKLSGPGKPAADFCISGPEDHGVPGMVNLFGIESPGLTACLAIAEHAVRELEMTPRAGSGLS